MRSPPPKKKKVLFDCVCTVVQIFTIIFLSFEPYVRFEIELKKVPQRPFWVQTKFINLVFGHKKS